MCIKKLDSNTLEDTKVTHIKKDKLLKHKDILIARKLDTDTKLKDVNDKLKLFKEE